MFSPLPSRQHAFLAILTASATLAAGAVAQSPTSGPASQPRQAAPYAAQQIRIPSSARPPQKQAAKLETAHTAKAAAKPASEQTAGHAPRQTSQLIPERNPAVSADAAAVRVPSRQASLVRQAAHGQILDELPPEPLSRPVAVRQASHSEHRGQNNRVAQASHHQNCGCDHCSGTALHGDRLGSGEPSCGIGGGCGIAACQDPRCGAEVSCGIEAGYAPQPACGVEAIGCHGYGCDVGSCHQCINGCSPFRVIWKRFEFFAGVNSFTGPANHAAVDAESRHGGSSSFGFYEGLNEGRSLGHLIGLDLAAQLGLRATQSSLSGAEFTDEARKQIFLTGGLFRRVDFGLQYGLVLDYLYDDWWYRNNLTQLRGELSWNDACGHEFGYQFMAGTKSSTSRTRLLDEDNALVRGTAAFEPTNQHRLFLRGNTAGGGSYLAFAGGTDRGDGLLGASLMSAFRGRFAVQGGATYLIPSESNRRGGYENEAWNLSMGVVFRPGGKAACGRYCRPMFDVADNGSFLIDRN